MGAQNSTIALVSRTRAENERGRPAHHIPASTPAVTPIARPPASSHRSQATPRSQSTRTGGQPRQLHATPKSKCRNTRPMSCAVPERTDGGSGPYRSGRSTRVMA
jgi:hypothetical protein